MVSNMLALSRKKNEALIINNNVEITILEIKGDQVKIGVSAPKDIPVYRKEVYVQIQKENELIEAEYQALLADYLASNHRRKVAIIEKAFKFACQAHHGVRRRSGEPYIMHPIAVARIVAGEIGLGSTSICSALLHDVVEDTDITVDQIRAEFGDHIAYLVEMESDKFTNPKGENLTWKERKLASLERLANAPLEVKQVAMGDKLSNMRTIAMDYRKIGDVLWNRFHAPNGKADYAWYYRELGNSLNDLADTDAHAEYCTLYHLVFD